MLYKASYYNMRVPHRGGVLLFNGKTGALLRLSERTAAEFSSHLGEDRARTAGQGYSSWSPPRFTRESLPASISNSWDDLIDAGVFIPADEDERDRLRGEFEDGREQSPFYVTVTTTLNCNMRCYYCYQKDDDLGVMTLETAEQICEWIKTRLREKGYKRLYLEWYGGEPMLNQEAIELVSDTIIPFCQAEGVDYKASMICNGTNWPKDVEAFIERTKLFRVQFSIDGPEDVHNKKRGTLGESGRGRNPSYQEVMNTVDSVVNKLIVYFRINIDPMLGWRALEMLDEMDKRGWLKPSNRFFPYAAKIIAMTEHCGFIGKSPRFKEFDDEFTKIQRAFYEQLSLINNSAAREKPLYYPARRLVNCAAVNNNSATFGPDGLMYKCGLDVGDAFRAHDAVQGVEKAQAKKAIQLDRDRWDKYDPFTHERCSECQYLPACLGGCPKAQIERDDVTIRAASAHFEQNFDHMIQEMYDLNMR